MKKRVILIVAGAALFAAGYWAGGRQTGTDRPSGKGGPVLSAARSSQGTNVEAAGASNDKVARNFIAGHPFVKGQAKAWLLSLAASLKESGGAEGQIAVVDMAQLFLTMDEESVLEVSAALKELLALYAAGDPAMKAIPESNDLAKGALVLSAFRLSQLNPAAALAMLKDLPEGTPDEAFKFVFARVALQNPAQAEAMLGSLDPKRRKDALEGILDTLKGKDPAAALALAGRYPGEVSDRAEQDIITRLVLKDPLQGMTAAIGVAESGKRAEILRHAIGVWSEQDRNAAAAWAESYTGPGQTTARGWLLEQKMAADPQAVLTEFTALQQTVPDAKELSETAGFIARHLAEKDFAAAREWAVNQPSGPVREEAVPAILTQWAEQDAGGASAWISALPPGMERDNSTDYLVEVIKHSDPSAAFEWARNMQSEDRRNASMNSVLSEWRKQDPGAAKAAVEALPPEMRKALPYFE